MRARRQRRRLFNLFAFACLAFAIYLIAFTKEDVSAQQASKTAQTTASIKTVKNAKTR
ncbi:MAG TPA: hypothetical protein VM187_00735 [Niastella sp.]|nr:hypothetical protein [Niastella sp.]